MSTPSDILVTGGIVRELERAGVLVATLATVDADVGDTFTYALDDPSGAFEIVGSEIRVLDGSVLDFETAQSIFVTVTVTDSTGNTYSEQVEIQVLDVNEITGTDNPETIEGSVGDDVILALGGNDRVNASGGADSVDGGLGNDTLYGGNGNDTLLGNGGYDSLVGEGGDDVLDAGADGGNLDGGEGNDTLLGGSANNRLFGGNGDDSLFGGNGTNQLYDGAGQDTLSGGTGPDEITVTSDGSDDVAYGGGGRDYFFLYGYGYQDNATSAFGTDSVDGGAGDDWFEVSESNDRVLASGGDGNDRFDVYGLAGELLGDAGNDAFYVYYGSNNSRSLLIDSGADDDIINLNGRQGTLLTVLSGDGNDQIISIGSGTIDAGAGDDTLTMGISGLQPTITLGDGQDTFTVTFWNNTASVTITDFDAGAGGDRLDINAVLASNLVGWDVSSNPFATLFVRLEQDGTDTLLQIDRDGAAAANTFTTLVRLQNTTAGDFIAENFSPAYPPDGSTPAGETITGTENAETIEGSVGDDVILALGGNDRVNASGGADSVDGGLGNDTLYGGNGNDTLLGNGGYDSLVGEGGDDVLDAGADGGNLDGGEGNDTLLGGSANNRLFGGNGDDSLFGGNGTNQLYDGAGQDTLSGGTGPDEITVTSDGSDDVAYGGGGRDYFFLYGYGYQDNATSAFGTDSVDGGAGDDWFEVSESNDRVLASGGDGNDKFDVYGLAGELLGDAGNDAFYVYYGSNNSRSLLIDSGADDDIINLNGRQGTLLTVLSGDGNDQIISIGSGTIDAGAGDDTLTMGISGLQPTITLGDGQDTFTVTFWNNTASVTITDFDAGAGGDRLDINAVLASNLVGWDVSSNPFATLFVRLEQDGTDTLLQIDRDGAAAANTFTTLVRLQNTTAGDFIAENFSPAYPPDGSTPAGETITGTENAETIEGSVGDDVILALGGNDRVNASGGADSVDGGLGNDTLYGGNGNDTLLGNGGYDSLVGEGGDDVLDAGADGGNLDGGEGNDTLLGGSANNRLFGGNGDDSLFGGNGTNQLYDGAGQDTLSGGTGPDEITVTSDGSDDVAYGGGGRDYFFLYGYGYQDNATSAFGTDSVDGGAGDDWFEVSESNDRVLASGGDGNDRFDVYGLAGELLGDAGNDAFYVYYGSNNSRSLLIDSGADDDIINLNGRQGTLLTVLSGDGNDQIISIGSGTIDAGAGDDTLTMGISGLQPTITLGDGQDTFTVTFWNNTASVTITDFDAGAGGDRLDINAVLASNLVGWDVSSNPFATLFVRLEQDGTDTLLQIDRDGVAATNTFTTLIRLQNTTAGDFIAENFSPAYPPAGGDLILGGPNIDNLVGGPGNDEIYGFADGDALQGGAGNDKLFGGAGNDTLAGEAGNDSLDGSDGSDTAVFSGNRNDYLISPNGDGSLILTDTRAGVPNGSDTLSSIEWVQFADTLVSANDLSNRDPAITPTPTVDGIVVEDDVLTDSGALTASDPDAGTTLNWSVVGGLTTGAADYTFSLDNLRIVRNGTVILDDPFSDGNPPPSLEGGNGPTEYRTSGGLTEGNGRLIFDDSDAVALQGVGTSTPIVGQIATVVTNVQADTTAGLRQAAAFTVEGRFDLVLPDSNREGYGIRLTDRLQAGSTADQPGNNTVHLSVRQLADGSDAVVLRSIDFAADTINVLGMIAIAPPLGADQIVLRLDHAAGADTVAASFDYLAGGVVVGTQIFEATATAFIGEDWLRAQVIASAPLVSGSTLAGNYGTLTVDQAGEWAYALANGQSNVQALAAEQTVTDSFTIQVSDGAGGIDTEEIVVQVNGVNDAPTGSPAAVLANGTEDESYGVSAADLLSGYTDVEGDTLAVANLSASNGLVTDNNDATYTITPDANFNGTMTLTYDVIDGNGGALAGQTLSYVVEAVDDAPTGAPTAVLANGTEDVAYDVTAVDLLSGFTDVDGDALTVASLSASNGSVADNNDGTYTITPSTNFNGTMTLTYNVIDGNDGVLSGQTLGYVVDPVNDAPSAGPDSVVTNEDVPIRIPIASLLANDTDPEGVNLTVITGLPTMTNGTAVLDGSDVVFTPDSDFNGVAGFTYTIADGTGPGALAATGTVTVTVNPINDAPTGTPTAGLADGTEDEPYHVYATALLSGFIDVDGDALAVENLSASDGTVTDNGDGAYTITPAANFNGKMTLTYDVIDGKGGVLPGQMLNYAVAAVNDPAVIGGATAGSVTEDTILVAEGELNVSDVDLGEAFFTAGTILGNYGSLDITADGAWTYTLANANSAVQSLATGESLFDVIAVTSLDGTEQAITITIDGLDEPNNPNGQAVDGDAGDNTLDTSTQGGSDVVNAGAGNDVVSTGSGDDLVQAGAGDDSVSGGSGNDVIFGGSGNDSIDGGDGNDALDGGAGNDIIIGGAGTESITGGLGDDTLTGGSQSDTFVFQKGFGNDLLTDFRVRGGQHDVVEFSTDVFADWAAVQEALSDGPSGAVITTADGDTITFAGVTAAQLTANYIDDFRFV